MELQFENVVIYTAVVLLILLLVFVGVVLHYSKATVNRSYMQQCPDNFTAVPVQNTDGSTTYQCVVPSNLQSAFSASSNPVYTYNKNVAAKLNYNSANQTINFTDPMWSGAVGQCNKYQWTTNNNFSLTPGGIPITWDGITNLRSPCK